MTRDKDEKCIETADWQYQLKTVVDVPFHVCFISMSTSTEIQRTKENKSKLINTLFTRVTDFRVLAENLKAQDYAE